MTSSLSYELYAWGRARNEWDSNSAVKDLLFLGNISHTWCNILMIKLCEAVKISVSYQNFVISGCQEWFLKSLFEHCNQKKLLCYIETLLIIFFKSRVQKICYSRVARRIFIRVHLNPVIQKNYFVIQGGPERMQHLQSLISKKPWTKSN